VQGVATRSFDGLVKAIGMSGISKASSVGPCAVIDEKMKRSWAARLRVIGGTNGSKTPM
jgi:hypothetical protein